jgi:carbon storage regulator
MLILSRKANQQIVINDNIVVEILGIRSGGHVAIGITAPRDIVIMREELLDRPPPLPEEPEELACVGG